MFTLVGIILKAKAFFQLLLDAFLKLAAFLLKPRQVFLPLLIPVVICIGVYVLWGRYDDAVEKHELYLAEVKEATAERDKENLAKEKATIQRFASINANHANQLQQIWSQANELKITNSRNTRTINDLRSQLRNSVESYATDGLPGFPETTGISPESGGDCDAAIARSKALIPACRLTTADYNSLAESWEKACEIHGCE